MFSSGSPLQDDAASGIRRFPVSLGTFPRYAAGDWLGIQDPQQRAAYVQAMADSGADVVLTHCWQAWNTDWLMDAQPDLKVPVVLFSHGTSVNTRTGRLGWLRRARWRAYAWWRMPRSLKLVSAFIALADHVDQDRFLDVALARAQGVPVHVVPNGCSDSVLMAAGSVGMTLREPLILSVGQYTPDKNFEAVLDAFLRLTQPGWRLALCGSSETGYLDHLRARVAALPRDVGSRVEFHIGLDRAALTGLYQRAAVFAFASRTECQPLVLLDAMAAGIPFVTSNVGCVASFEGGWVADDPATFAWRLSALVADAELRASVGRQGHAAALRDYQWSSSIKRLEGLLATVVAASSVDAMPTKNKVSRSSGMAA